MWNRDAATHVQRAHNVREESIKLERELAEARETISYMVENGNAAYYEVKAQRDALAEALRGIRQQTRGDCGCRVCTDVYHSSNQALATLKGAADE